MSKSWDDIDKIVSGKFLKIKNGFLYILSLENLEMPRRVESTRFEDSIQYVNQVILKGIKISNKNYIAILKDENPEMYKTVKEQEINDIYNFGLASQAVQIFKKFFKDNGLMNEKSELLPTAKDFLFTYERKGSGFDTQWLFNPAEVVEAKK